MFKVGSNQVIRGWDEAVRDMATGEKVFYEFGFSVQSVSLLSRRQLTSLDFFFKNLIFNPILLITVPQATVAIESAWAYGKKGVPEVIFCCILFFSFLFFFSFRL